MLLKKLHNARYAWQGIKIAWREEISFRLQILAMAIAFSLGWFFRVSHEEWLFIGLTISFVLTAEVFNTALEELCDKFKTDLDPHIAKIKDLSAGAVLIASCAAIFVGIVIFIPHIRALFS